ncbi:MAG: hypothetical protein ACKOBW_17265 [Planctomycetota bacterium]
MNCADFETRLNDLLDDRQTPSDDPQLFQHARECLACRQLLVQLQTMAEVSDFLGATRPVPHERHCSPCWRREAAGERAACRRREEASRLSDESCEAEAAAADEAVAPERATGRSTGPATKKVLAGNVGLARKVGRPLLLVCLLLSVVVGIERAVTRWDARDGGMPISDSSGNNVATGRSLPLSAERLAELWSGDLGPRRAASVMEVVVYDPLFVWPKRAMRVAGQLPAAPTPTWDVRAWAEPTTWVEPVAEQLVSERLTELRTEPWQLVAGWASGMRPLAASMTTALEDLIDVWVPPMRDEAQRRLPLESDQWDWRWDFTA